LDTAILGTRNVLELARHTGARVLVASTSEVYGDPLTHPQPETYWGNVNPVGKRACYDEGKRAAEAFAIAYAERYGLDVRLARIFNTYGPRMREDDGRVVSNFVTQALRGQPLTVYGRGEQTRSLCYVSDLIDGLVRMMHRDRCAGPINLGNPEELTVRALAELVLDVTQSSSAIEHHPLPVDDPVRRRPDIGLAQRLLGWSPRVDLRDGMRRTAAFFRERLAQPAPPRRATWASWS
jgi:UDP-glucuronate decarboxylase